MTTRGHTLARMPLYYRIFIVNPVAAVLRSVHRNCNQLTTIATQFKLLRTGQQNTSTL